MAITFHLISTSLNAQRGLGGATAKVFYDAAAGALAPVVVSDATPGVFGGKLIQLSDGARIRGLGFPFPGNFPAPGPMSIQIRIVPRFTGNPATNQMLFSCEGVGIWQSSSIWCYIGTNGSLSWTLKDQFGAAFVNRSSSVFSPTLVSGTPIEFLFVWDGTANANSVSFSCNGVIISQIAANLAATSWQVDAFSYMAVAFSNRFSLAQFDLNELVIYNTALSPTYTVGTTFVADTAFDAGVYTDPNFINVANGVNYTFAGVPKTGTLNSVTNVLSSATLTGQSLNATLIQT